MRVGKLSDPAIGRRSSTSLSLPTQLRYITEQTEKRFGSTIKHRQRLWRLNGGTGQSNRNQVRGIVQAAGFVLSGRERNTTDTGVNAMLQWSLALESSSTAQRITLAVDSTGNVPHSDYQQQRRRVAEMMVRRPVWTNIQLVKGMT